MIKNSRPRLLTNVLGIYLLFLGIFFTGCNPDSSPVVPADPGLLISHEVITTYESSDFERI
jgi:hypothetical protein